MKGIQSRSVSRWRTHVDGVHVERDVRVPMRDGVHICCDVYRPDDGGTKCPALYAMSPYQKDLAGLPAYPTFPHRETGPIEWYVGHGYVYVLADSRGTGRSQEGRWDYLAPDEQTDLYDTIEWIAAQEWCNGRVGMIGQSYFGVAQWCAAVQNPPHLACVAPYDARVDHYRDAVYHGGIPMLGYPMSWSFGLRYNHKFGPPGDGSERRLGADLATALLEHPMDDDFWRIRSPFWKLRDCHVPVFSIGSWAKSSIHLRGNLLGYEGVSGPRKLLVEQADQPLRLGVIKAQEEFDRPEFHERVLLPWYDYWLKGIDNGLLDEAPVRLYVSGAETYEDFDMWPPAAARSTSFYLRGECSSSIASINRGGLEMEIPADELDWSSYSYPRSGWHSGPIRLLEDGTVDKFSETLTWSSGPLMTKLKVVGPIELVIYVRSSADDTDVFAKVWDFAENGMSRLLSRGWLRASHRELDSSLSTDGRPFHGHRTEVPLESGQFTKLNIEIFPVAHVFGRGHRICLQIANCDSRITDGNYYHYYGLKYGSDDFAHCRAFPSELRLPVLDE